VAAATAGSGYGATVPMVMDMRRFASWLPLAAVIAALAVPSGASASALVAQGGKHVTLKVGAHNRAVLSYSRDGIRRHVLIWGAVNAKVPDAAHPDSQVQFHLDYSGGSASPWGSGYWRKVKNICTPYRGSGLHGALLVCTMPDGSHWAVQRWRRLMPNGGWPCCQTSSQGHRELHVSHWKGALPVFWLKWNWTRSTSKYPHLDKLYGRSTYKGVGTYGFSATRSGAPTDRFGRVVYVDGYNPPKWGKGWRRENSFLVHRKSNGGFCDALWPSRYGRSHSSGYAEKYRATVDGPGVMPMMYWQGPPPGNYQPSPVQTRDGLADYTITGWERTPYDLTLATELNAEQRIVAGSDLDTCWHLW
jgi:hypothetical protein